MTLREQYFAELYRDYLSLTLAQLADLDEEAPFALTTGAVWPANDVVKRLCPHDDAGAALPCLAMVASEGKTKHPHLLNVDVFVRLQIQAQIDAGSGGEELAGTPMATAQAWLQAITEAIHASETFRAYLLSLSDTQRTGGEILMRMAAAGIAHDHEAGSRTHTWELIISHKVDVSPADD